MTSPLGLKQPRAMSLTRVSDRLTFLYLDRCRVERDDNGVHALVEPTDPETGETKRWTTYLPISTITTLMLGTGTSITAPAVAACSRSGCGIVFTGAGAVRSYGAFLSPYASSELLEAQARQWAAPGARVDAAKRALSLRFPDLSGIDPGVVSLEQLRGFEGARMRATYQAHAKKHRLTGWKRNYTDPQDGANIAMNYGNTALYGLANAVVQALGLAPGLGFIHSGNRQAFVLDLADIYKTSIVIPKAFALHSDADPGRAMMDHLRDQLRLLRVLPRMVEDIRGILGEPAEDPELDWDVDSLDLWAPSGMTAAGNNRIVDLSGDW